MLQYLEAKGERGKEAAFNYAAPTSTSSGKIALKLFFHIPSISSPKFAGPISSLLIVHLAGSFSERTRRQRDRSHDPLPSPLETGLRQKDSPPLSR